MERWSTKANITCADVQNNVQHLREQVALAAQRAGRSAREITVLAVTKTVEPELINCAIDCGIRHIGENRVQEFLEKKEHLKLDGVCTHLIGRLQTNKVKKIIGQVDVIESLDRLSLAREINRLSLAAGVVTDCLIEVNIGREQNKSGVLAEEIEDFLGRMAEFPYLRVRGLMAIPPVCDESIKVRRYFSHMHQLFLDIKAKTSDNVCIDCLSMGMSGDYFEAILEGATLIRPGTALFGSRLSAR